MKEIAISWTGFIEYSIIASFKHIVEGSGMKIFAKKRLQIIIAMFLASTLAIAQSSYADSDGGFTLDGAAFGTAGVLAVGAGIPALIAMFVKRSASSPTASAPIAGLISIKVTPVSPTVALGSTTQFTATGTYADNSTADITSQVTWSSSNTPIATVDNTGVANAVAFGTASIQATVSGLTDQTTLKIVEGGPVILSISNHNLAYSSGGVRRDATSVSGKIIVLNNSNTTQNISTVGDISPISIVDNTCSSIGAWGTCTFIVSYSGSTQEIKRQPSQATLPTSKPINFKIQDSNGKSDAITINAIDITSNETNFYDPSIYDTNAKGLPYAPNTIVKFNKNGFDFLYASLSDRFDYYGARYGVFRSSDNGITWSPVNNGLEGGGLKITSLSVTKDNVLCASAYGYNENGKRATNSFGLYTYDNSGENWSLVKSLNFVNVLHYSSNGVLYAGVGNMYANAGAIYLSTDNGSNWGDKINTEPFYGITALYTAQDQNDHTRDVLYVASLNYDDTNYSYHSYIYRGTFDGTTWTWTKIEKDFFEDYDTYIYALYVDATGRYLYVGTNTGIYVSSDSGVNWQKAVNSEKKYYVGNFATIGDRLYAGTVGENPDNSVYNLGGVGMLVSGDNGSSWQSLNGGLKTPYTNIFSLSAIDESLYIGTDIGFFRRDTYSNLGWIQKSAMLTMQVVQSLCAIGNNLYAGLAMGFGVYMSSDSGANWKEVNVGLTNTYINTLYPIAGALYAATSNGIFKGIIKTEDNNISINWSSIGLSDKNVLTLYSDATNLYVGTDGATNNSAGVFVSSLEPWNWQEKGLNGEKVTALYSAGNDLYAGTYKAKCDQNLLGSVHKWSTTARDWQKIVGNDNNPLSQDITSLYFADNKLYAGSSASCFNAPTGGVFYIDVNDNSSSWSQVSSMSSKDVQHLYLLNDMLYASIRAGNTGSKGVYSGSVSSPDQNWTQIFNNLDTYIMHSISSDLYIGTNQGVLKSIITDEK